MQVPCCHYNSSSVTLVISVGMAEQIEFVSGTETIFRILTVYYKGFRVPGK